MKLHIDTIVDTLYDVNDIVIFDHEYESDTAWDDEDDPETVTCIGKIKNVEYDTRLMSIVYHVIGIELFHMDEVDVAEKEYFIEEDDITSRFNETLYNYLKSLRFDSVEPKKVPKFPVGAQVGFRTKNTVGDWSKPITGKIERIDVSLSGKSYLYFINTGDFSHRIDEDDIIGLVF